MNIKNPLEVEKILIETTDNLGMPIDSRIFKACVILNSLGYKTRQSCQGHAENYTTYPWIEIYYNEQVTPEYYLASSKHFYDNLFQDLKYYYQTKEFKYDEMITFEKFKAKIFIVRLSQQQNSKCFKNKREEKLETYLYEINDFCQFLNQKYDLNY
jgi:hypothetical protein